MKNLITIFIVFLIFVCCNQKTNNPGPDAANGIKPDTKSEETTNNGKNLEDSVRMKLGIDDSIKVLTYEKHPDWHVFVFIDYNRISRLYNGLESNFNTGDVLDYAYKEFGEINPKTNDSISRLLREDYDFLLKKWVEVYSLDSELYVIDACDFARERYLTDSLVFDGYLMGMPELSIIEGVTKISAVKTQLKARTLRHEKRVFDFYEIDKRGTFLVVLSGKYDKDIITYMTTSDKVRNYNLVYHDCINMTDKYEFDLLDYEKIVKELNN